MTPTEQDKMSNQSEKDYTHPDEMPIVEQRPNPHSDLRGTIVHFTSEMLDNPNNYGIYPTTNFYNDLEEAIIDWHKKQIEEIARTAFKKSVYLNVDGDAKYWSDSGDYNSQAMDRFFPQEWFDQKFMPAIEAERNKLNPSKSTPFNKLKEQANDETL